MTATSPDAQCVVETAPGGDETRRCVTPERWSTRAVETCDAVRTPASTGNVIGAMPSDLPSYGDMRSFMLEVGDLKNGALSATLDGLYADVESAMLADPAAAFARMRERSIVSVALEPVRRALAVLSAIELSPVGTAAGATLGNPWGYTTHGEACGAIFEMFASGLASAEAPAQNSYLRECVRDSHRLFDAIDDVEARASEGSRLIGTKAARATLAAVSGLLDSEAVPGAPAPRTCRQKTDVAELPAMLKFAIDRVALAASFDESPLADISLKVPRVPYARERVSLTMAGLARHVESPEWASEPDARDDLLREAIHEGVAVTRPHYFWERERGFVDLKPYEQDLSVLSAVDLIDELRDAGRLEARVLSARSTATVEGVRANSGQLLTRAVEAVLSQRAWGDFKIGAGAVATVVMPGVGLVGAGLFLVETVSLSAVGFGLRDRYLSAIPSGFVVVNPTRLLRSERVFRGTGPWSRVDSLRAVDNAALAVAAAYGVRLVDEASVSLPLAKGAEFTPRRSAIYTKGRQGPGR